VAHAPKDSADTAVKNFVLSVEMTEKALQAAVRAQRREAGRSRPAATASTRIAGTRR
jgi:hypothetical protein